MSRHLRESSVLVDVSEKEEPRNTQKSVMWTHNHAKTWLRDSNNTSASNTSFVLFWSFQLLDKPEKSVIKFLT